MLISKMLQDFIEDNSSSRELEKRYPQKELVQDIRNVLCHSISELIGGRNVSYTDLQTDLRPIVNAVKICHELTKLDFWNDCYKIAEESKVCGFVDRTVENLDGYEDVVGEDVEEENINLVKDYDFKIRIDGYLSEAFMMKEHLIGRSCTIDLINENKIRFDFSTLHSNCNITRPKNSKDFALNIRPFVSKYGLSHDDNNFTLRKISDYKYVTNQSAVTYGDDD